MEENILKKAGIISEEKLREEQEILEQVFRCSDVFQSCVFKSGAGSGKTYALVELLKYLIHKNGERLEQHNQKIACITFTNVAADNIKAKIGASDLVQVSTIHERIWSMICVQKSALLSMHKEKLQSEIDNMTEAINSAKEYNTYRALSEPEKAKFFAIMNQNKRIFNQAYNYRAQAFKEAMPEEIRTDFKELLKNFSNFKKIVSTLFRIERYQKCLVKIEARENDYQTVSYDASFNEDRLDKMRISHKTVLEYGLTMVRKYPRMRQSIIDQYPYILIDEYQDTAENVVEIMSLLDAYSVELKHPVFIAYFGDPIQSIYDEGISDKLEAKHAGLSCIKKEFNRRSYQEIIEVGNRIRQDSIVQQSIYTNCTGATIELKFGPEDGVSAYIEKCVRNLQITPYNKLHCMSALNEMVAKYSGFGTLFHVYKQAPAYRGKNYEQLNSELLSTDLERLGKTQVILYRLLKMYNDIQNTLSPIRDILPIQEQRNITFGELREFIRKIQSLTGNNLQEFLKRLFEEYDVTTNCAIKLYFQTLFDIEDLSYNNVLSYFQQSLNPNAEETDAQDIVEELFKIEFKELKNWYDYICRSSKEPVIFHTIHGTKGLEYDNVVLILGKDFGIKNKNFFEDFFKNYSDSSEKSQKYEKARNLLYVAVTRTIKNLRVYYIDDSNSVKENMERVLGIRRDADRTVSV